MEQISARREITNCRYGNFCVYGAQVLSGCCPSLLNANWQQPLTGGHTNASWDCSGCQVLCAENVLLQHRERFSLSEGQFWGQIRCRDSELSMDTLQEKGPFLENSYAVLNARMAQLLICFSLGAIQLQI